MNWVEWGEDMGLWVELTGRLGVVTPRPWLAAQVARGMQVRRIQKWPQHAEALGGRVSPEVQVLVASHPSQLPQHTAAALHSETAQSALLV